MVPLTLDNSQWEGIKIVERNLNKTFHKMREKKSCYNCVNFQMRIHLLSLNQSINQNWRTFIGQEVCYFLIGLRQQHQYSHLIGAGTRLRLKSYLCQLFNIIERVNLSSEGVED